ncbi:MAG: 50S ribosomal protein L18 [Candidatus Saccharibacteria bacterium]|nr:50S ribosomal protein L18 [Candidatus Saccharibacteria bacterium]
MTRLSDKLRNLSQRKRRVRSTITGTAEKPRLSVFISNKHVFAQLIDDTSHSTIAAATTVGQKKLTGTMTEKAEWVGEQIAKKAKSSNVKQVVFDRNGRLYHGRIKALAEAARAGGLEF